MKPRPRKTNQLPRAPQSTDTVDKMNKPQRRSAFRMGHKTPFLAHILVYLKVKGEIMLYSVGLQKYFSMSSLLVCHILVLK